MSVTREGMALTLVLVVATACASAGGAATSRTPQPIVPHGDISGLWRYDARVSTTPGAQLTDGAQADSGMRGEGGRGMRGRGFGGTEGGFRGRGEGEEAGEGGERGEQMPPFTMSDRARLRLRETMRLATDAGGVLQISQTDSTVRIVRPERGDTILLRADGLKVKEQPPAWGGKDAGAIETSSLWASGQLFVTRAVDGGGKVTEIYYRQPDDPDLYVVVRVEGGPLRRKIEFRRVYDPVTAPGS